MLLGSCNAVRFYFGMIVFVMVRLLKLQFVCFNDFGGLKNIFCTANIIILTWVIKTFFQIIWENLLDYRNVGKAVFITGKREMGNLQYVQYPTNIMCTMCMLPWEIR